MSRREYKLTLVVNELFINKVIIDSHYEEKHSGSVDDQTILELVKTLNGEIIEVDAKWPPFTYFVTDRIELGNKLYKLVWLLEEHQLYIGVVNAYRRR